MPPGACSKKRRHPKSTASALPAAAAAAAAAAAPAGKKHKPAAAPAGKKNKPKARAVAAASKQTQQASGGGGSGDGGHGADSRSSSATTRGSAGAASSRHQLVEGIPAWQRAIQWMKATPCAEGSKGHRQQAILDGAGISRPRRRVWELIEKDSQVSFTIDESGKRLIRYYRHRNPAAAAAAAAAAAPPKKKPRQTGAAEAAAAAAATQQSDIKPAGHIQGVYIGRSVRKAFPPRGRMFDGTVVAYDPVEKLYMVRYQDGDEEELSLAELRAVLEESEEDEEQGENDEVLVVGAVLDKAWRLPASLPRAARPADTYVSGDGLYTKQLGVVGSKPEYLIRWQGYDNPAEVRTKALPFCCTSTAFPSKTAPCRAALLVFKNTWEPSPNFAEAGMPLCGRQALRDFERARPGPGDISGESLSLSGTEKPGTSAPIASHCHRPARAPAGPGAGES